MPVSEGGKAVAAGRLARAGLLDPAACAAAEAVLVQVVEQGIETLRVVFPDQHGIFRGKTLTAHAARSVFTSGLAVPSTLLLKDTSNRTAFPVWSADPGISAGPMQGAGDVLLVPDPDRFRILPWAPHSAWLLCDVLFRDGTPIPFAPRTVLQGAIDRLADRGMAARMGLEVEFNLFEVTDPALDHADTTMPPRPPQTRALNQGYQFLSDGRYGDAEEILDLLRRSAQGLDLPVRSVEIEMGPSQFEFTFDPGDPMQIADAMMMFRAMTREVCARRGLYASFMAKPKIENAFANGWHIHQSVEDQTTGRNLFTPDGVGELTAEAAGWIAGLLEHATESSLLIAPTVNSYKRYQPYQLAPNRIQWGQDNRGAMIRALLETGRAARVENRAADSTANPYYAFAAQIVAGLEGMAAGLTPPPPSDTPYDDAARALPTDLGAAIAAFDRSRLFREALGDDMVDYLCHLKRAEWGRYLADVSDWEQREYFGLF